MLRHALRTSLLPFVNMFGLVDGALVGGAALLTEVVFGLNGVGRLTFHALQNRLENGAQLDDETRRWLLRAALRADRGAALQLTAAIARGTKTAPSAGFRLSAARELLDADRAFAGEVLRQIVDIESSRGVTRTPPPELATDYERAIGVNVGSQFFNFIHLFAATGHPEAEFVLRQVLGRNEHDMLTIQECVRELGRLKSAAAAPRIRELFDHPPGNTFNPMFQNACLQAVVEIEGAAACDWLREKQRTETTEMVAGRLQELVKQLCN